MSRAHLKEKIVPTFVYVCKKYVMFQIWSFNFVLNSAPLNHINFTQNWGLPRENMKKFTSSWATCSHSTFIYGILLFSTYLFLFSFPSFTAHSVFKNLCLPLMTARYLPCSHHILKFQQDIWYRVWKDTKTNEQVRKKKVSVFFSLCV
jgi:hypothetical protein